jgi:hypothetical protein
MLSSALMVLALTIPALWNGFPIIFPDTGGYLTRPRAAAVPETDGRAAAERKDQR